MWSSLGFPPKHERSWAATIDVVGEDWCRHFPTHSNTGAAQSRRTAMGLRLRKLILGLLHECLVVYNRFRRGPDTRAVLQPGFRAVSSPSWDEWREYIQDLDRLCKQQRAENLDSAHVGDDAPVRAAGTSTSAAPAPVKSGERDSVVADLKRQLAEAKRDGKKLKTPPAPKVHGWTADGKVFRVGDIYYSRALAEQQLRDLGVDPNNFCIELLIMSTMPIAPDERMKSCVHGAGNAVKGHEHASDTCHHLRNFKAGSCRCSAEGVAIERDARQRGGGAGSNRQGGTGARAQGKGGGKGKDGKGAKRKEKGAAGGRNFGRQQ